MTPDNGTAAFADADCIVNYGMTAKDTITLSSIGEKECVLALQRELVTADGVILERQELIVSRAGLTPEELMAAEGTLLLAGMKMQG